MRSEEEPRSSLDVEYEGSDVTPRVAYRLGTGHVQIAPESAGAEGDGGIEPHTRFACDPFSRRSWNLSSSSPSGPGLAAVEAAGIEPGHAVNTQTETQRWLALFFRRETSQSRGSDGTASRRVDPLKTIRFRSTVADLGQQRTQRVIFPPACPSLRARHTGSRTGNAGQLSSRFDGTRAYALSLSLTLRGYDLPSTRGGSSRSFMCRRTSRSRLGIAPGAQGGVDDASHA